jgi:Major capsid protein N-terminus/Large eukaryotic DNA virus major capsid protein
MSGFCTVSTAAGFIDMATFSEVESFLYGGPHAISLFVAGVQKVNWFTQVAIGLRNNGCFDFGQSCVSSSLNRSGDYVLNTWFRLELPSVAWIQGAQAAGNAVRWTRNLMHNIIEKVSITFNELIVEEFDHHWLDFNYMFRIPANKRVGYKNMIGDIPSLTTYIDAAVAVNNPTLTGGALQGGHFQVPIPFFYAEDSGIALPIASLPFNDVKINYSFRCLDDLLVFMGPAVSTISNLQFMWVEFSPSLGTISWTADTTQSFRHGTTHAHYAVIHNDERVKMGDAPRDMLIRQVQSVHGCECTSGSELCFDVRLSHSIIHFFFALKNKTLKGEQSNYTTNVNYGVTGEPPGLAPQPQGYPGQSPWWDPIHSTKVVYENTVRIESHSDYYSLTAPWYYHEAIPDETGYHSWTYAIKPWDPLMASGSTNYSKLANVRIEHKLSHRAVFFRNNPLPGAIQGTGENAKVLKLHNVFTAQNWNIARVANGSLGHPTL